ncbi:MAG: type II CRISPR RNA-guided endonuclease Cas9, partial [Aequorivita sp.]|nr:type II CRISPR RNA-guided endonuclease Cas9 [Aequorivita sp.]
MARILGLDLGTNSVGWALIDDADNKVLGMGSRIFPMGVDNLGDGTNEMSKNASRTGARGVRRQFFRRRLRKKILLKTLSEYGMCPLKEDDFKNWKRSKKFPSEKLAVWFAHNPYELRNKALTEKISLEEMGRIFYHLIQRRGFLSNSRKGGKDDGAIFKGNAKEGKIGIDETRQSIQDKTLGAYLYKIYPKENKPFVSGLERIRNRYTTRKMYVDEFENIWENQKQYHSELTADLKTIIGGRKQDGYGYEGVLFHQRPLRSQKHLVGNCSFEPNKTKCPISAIPNELRRIYEWVNTVECNGKKITQEEREKVIAVLLSKEKPAFKDLKKAIGKVDANHKFNYKDEDKIVGTHTISNLSNKKFFGKQWFEFSEKEQEDIWHVLYFFDNKDKVKEYAIAHWGFDDDKAIAISNVNLKDGYANLSRKAINNILPFLKLGFTYDVSVALGGIRNAFGKDWERLEEEKKSFILDNVPEIVRSKISGGYIETLKALLKKEYGLTEKQLAKLYHHSAAINAEEILDKLPVGKDADKEIQAIRNPIVITALFELRKLVNELIEEHGKFDEIKVEMARDLKISKTRRNEIRREQQRLERENDRIKDELNRLGERITHDNILKYKLWEECKKTCPYTGVTIPVHKLFTGEVQIEHIHPWSRSLNDSFMNKTLCWADENRRKGDRTPFEFYGNDEANWLTIKERTLKLFSDTKEYPNAYQKFKRFVQQKFDDDFTTRQLNDTRYISKEAKNYLKQICEKVNVAPGQMTATLRHFWGLNSVLNDENEKTREDHRHHAIDALVMACGKTQYLQELSKWNRYDRQASSSSFPLPWETFRYDAEQAVDSILVSHKKQNNIITIRSHKTEKNGRVYKNLGVAARGQLHLETVYGQNKNCNNDEYVYRVDLKRLSFSQLSNIIDDKLKEVIINQIKKFLTKDEKDFFNKMISKEKKLDKSLQKAIKGKVDNILKEESFFMPNEGKRYKKLNKLEPFDIERKPVPIKKVRVKKVLGKAERLNDDIKQYVDPQNNHHVLIYKDAEGNLKEEVVTFWTVVERKRKGFPVYQLPPDGSEIVTTMQINDMFLLGIDEEEINWGKPNNSILKEHLYRVQKFTSGDYYFRISKTASINNAEEKQQINSFGFGKNG